MTFTELFAKVVGPVLLVRALSIVLGREHFVEVMKGLEREVSTVSFSFFPIALFITCVAIAVTHTDTSSLAAIVIHLIAWGGIAKSTALMLFPKLVVKKVQLLERAGFLNLVLLVCFILGGYLTWFGYLSSSTSPT